MTTGYAVEAIMAGTDRLLTPDEVGALFGVEARTVKGWARAGRIGRVRTPGRNVRFYESEVRALLAGDRT
jgi:excisionase family DNA binding protein